MHDGLAWLGASAEGAAWLKRLPAMIAHCTARWSLKVGEPFEYAFESFAAPATLPDGTEVVLKLAFRGRENEHEAAALDHWGGDGAVQLIHHDAERNALLLERATPGTPLKQLPPDDALDVLIDLLPRLWTPAAAPFRPLAQEAAWWAEYLEPTWERAGRPFERELLDAALAALDVLPRTQGEQVLVHQDLHADNVLRARRQPWLAIDPKPLLGEREFALAPIVRSGELGHSRAAVLHRLDRLAGALALDRDRARRWTIAQTLAWAITDEGAMPAHVEVARWLAEEG